MRVFYTAAIILFGFLLCSRNSVAQKATQPTLLMFADTPCDSMRSDTLWLANTSTSSRIDRLILLTLRDSSSYAINPMVVLPANIPENSSIPVRVTFTPGRRGQISDSLYAIIQTDHGNDTVRVRLTGRSIGSALSTTPSVLNFPRTDPGFSSTLKMIIRNSGELPQTLTDADIQLPLPFDLLTPMPITIAAGDSVVIEIRFEPFDKGVYSNSVNIISGCSQTMQVGLNGSTSIIGAGAFLQLSKNGFNPANNEQASCGVSECTPVVFTNAGNALLIIDSVFWGNGTNGYTPGTVPTPFYVAPNSQRVIQVCLDATKQGTLRDTMIVKSNDRTSIAFGMVIDVSGSMNYLMNCGALKPTRISQAIQKGQAFIDQTLLYLPNVGVQDQIAVMKFSALTNIQTIYPLTYVTDQTRAAAKASLSTLTANGGTYTGTALNQMIDTLAKSPLRRRVIVLLSDGAASDDKGITSSTAIINNARAKGIQFFTIGIGTDSISSVAAAQYLRDLALGTNGVAYSANDCGNIQAAFDSITAQVSRGQVTRLPFSIKIIRPLLTAPDIRFDSTYYHDTTCQSVTLTNVGQGDAIVDSAYAQDLLGGPSGEFFLDPTTQYPIKIVESGSVTVNVCFRPDGLRQRGGTAQYAYNSCPQGTLPLKLSGTGWAYANLRVNDIRVGLPGTTVTMPVYLDTALERYDVKTVTYTVRWNKTMLDLKKVQPSASSSSQLVLSAPVQYQGRYAIAQFTATGAFTDPPAALADMQFEVLRGDTLATQVELTTGKFEDGNPKAVLANAGLVAFDSTCFRSSKGILSDAATGKVVAGEPSPIPATSGSITIPLTADGETKVRLTIYSTDGMLVRGAEDFPLYLGTQKISISTQGLTAGAYYIYLQTPDGTTILKKVIVEK